MGRETQWAPQILLTHTNISMRASTAGSVSLYGHILWANYHSRLRRCQSQDEGIRALYTVVINHRGTFRRQGREPKLNLYFHCAALSLEQSSSPPPPFHHLYPSPTSLLQLSTSLTAVSATVCSLVYTFHMALLYWSKQWLQLTIMLFYLATESLVYQFKNTHDSRGFTKVTAMSVYLDPERMSKAQCITPTAWRTISCKWWINQHTSGHWNTTHSFCICMAASVINSDVPGD